MTEGGVLLKNSFSGTHKGNTVDLQSHWSKLGGSARIGLMVGLTMAFYYNYNKLRTHLATVSCPPLQAKIWEKKISIVSDNVRGKRPHRIWFLLQLFKRHKHYDVFPQEREVSSAHARLVPWSSTVALIWASHFTPLSSISKQRLKRCVNNYNIANHDVVMSPPWWLRQKREVSRTEATFGLRGTLW